MIAHSRFSCSFIPFTGHLRSRRICKLSLPHQYPILTDVHEHLILLTTRRKSLPSFKANKAAMLMNLRCCRMRSFTVLPFSLMWQRRTPQGGNLADWKNRNNNSYRREHHDTLYRLISLFLYFTNINFFVAAFVSRDKRWVKFN